MAKVLVLSKPEGANDDEFVKFNQGKEVQETLDNVQELITITKDWVRATIQSIAKQEPTKVDFKQPKGQVQEE